MSLVGGIVNDAKDLAGAGSGADKARSARRATQSQDRRDRPGHRNRDVIAIGGMLLMLMLVHVLAALTVIPLWGCYGIVGSVLVVLGGVLLAAGKTKAEEIDVVPQRTVERIKESAQWLTKQTTSDKR